MFDIILPTFNRAKFIERAINSVLAQRHRKFNLYVIDDGSTDQTEIILQKYNGHPQIQILKQDNKGVSSARNLGIRSSTQDWIAFLDSDDEWLPQKLEVQFEYITKNPQCRFVHSNEIWIRNGVRVNAKKKFDKSNNEIFYRSLETCLISPSTVVMKRDLSFEHGLFDESFVICEDYDLWLKILAKEKVGFIPQDLIYKHGGHDDQLSTTFVAMDFWRIKSLINLARKADLSEEQINQVNEQIEKKSALLMSNYLKHQNTAGLAELTSLLRHK